MPVNELPTHCPSCQSDMLVTRLTCPACGTEVTGAFGLSRLASLPEPHASLLELFLRVRGNVKDMERHLGLSYPTVRARLEEALTAAGLDRDPVPAAPANEIRQRRDEVLSQLEQRQITPAEAAAKLRDLRGAQSA